MESKKTNQLQLALAHICFVMKNQNLTFKINDQAKLMDELIIAFKLVFFKTMKTETISDDSFSKFVNEYEKTPSIRAVIHESNIIDIRFDWLFYNCLTKNQKFKLTKFIQTTSLDDWEKIRLSYVFFYDETPWVFINPLTPLLNTKIHSLDKKEYFLSKSNVRIYIDKLFRPDYKNYLCKFHQSLKRHQS